MSLQQWVYWAIGLIAGRRRSGVPGVRIKGAGLDSGIMAGCTASAKAGSIGKVGEGVPEKIYRAYG